MIPVGLGHGGINVVPGGRYVFAGAIADHVVDVIDPKTFKVIKRIDVGQGPHGVHASRDGRWVYAGVTGTNKVASSVPRRWTLQSRSRSAARSRSGSR